ncbi:MAG: hypothetical protein ACRD0Q_08555 [Acidimicrobiales bacterium]
MRKSCKAPATLAALSALLLTGLLVAAVPAGAAEKPKSDKTTTTMKDDAKSGKDDGSKAGKTTTTTTDGKGATTTTAKAGTKAPGGVTLTAYGVSVSGGPELAPRPPVRLSSCPATDTGTLPSTEAAGVLKTGTVTVVSGCTDSGGAKIVKSRADVSAVEIGTGASALTVGTIASACVANADGNQGGVVITDLKVAGKAIVVTDVAPNTPLSKLAKGLTGVVNEQVTTGDKLAVNGLRVTQGTADIVLGHVECSRNLTAAVGGPPVVGPTTTKAKPVATTVAGSKSKKDLANTGKGVSPSLVLALGALFVGILMRVGADGLLVLVPGGRARQRRRESTATLRRSPAYSWSPREPGSDASERLGP